MHVSDAVGSVERQLKDDIMAGLPQCGVEFYTHKHIDPQLSMLSTRNTIKTTRQE